MGYDPTQLLDTVAVCNEATGGIVILDKVPEYLWRPTFLFNTVPAVRAVLYAQRTIEYIQKNLPDIYGMSWIPDVHELILHTQSITTSRGIECILTYGVPSKWSIYITAYGWSDAYKDAVKGATGHDEE